ncbi:hypothetical protein AAF712_011531 [Marasmius tenuissimus]|uniref:Uncharacterized protein n=1 Tax=Marasmius tenuissimus TaxID=585030 RepID=A0ABR2ZKZ1_9AGAR
MARFNLSLLYIVLAAWAVNISMSAPVGLAVRHHDEATPSISQSLADLVIKRNKVMKPVAMNQNHNQNQTGQGANNGTATEHSSNPSQSFLTETGQGSNNGTATAIQPLNAKQKAQLLQCNVATSFIFTNLEELADLVLQIDTTDAAVAKAVTDAKQGIKTLGEGLGESISASISQSIGENVELDSKVRDGTQQLVSALTGIKSTQIDVHAAVAKIDDLVAAAESTTTACQEVGTQ